MHIESGPHNLDEPKTLKVSLPTRVHLKLHHIKILEGTNVSETVCQALEAYFESTDEA